MIFLYKLIAFGVYAVGYNKYNNLLNSIQQSIVLLICSSEDRINKSIFSIARN